MTATGDVTQSTTAERYAVRAERPSSPSWIARLMALQADGDALVAVRPSANGERLVGGPIAAQALWGATATVDDAGRSLAGLNRAAERLSARRSAPWG